LRNSNRSGRDLKSAPSFARRRGGGTVPPVAKDRQLTAPLPGFKASTCMATMTSRTQIVFRSVLKGSLLFANGHKPACSFIAAPPQNKSGVNATTHHLPGLIIIQSISRRTAGSQAPE